MKKSLTGVLALLAGAYAAYAQGSITMSDSYSINCNAICVYALDRTPLGGSNTGFGPNDFGNGNLWTVQLWAAPGSNQPSSALTSNAWSASFATNSTTQTPGAWYSTVLATIPGTSGGTVATIQLRVWYSGGGVTSYAAAVADGFPTGYSQTATVTLGGASPFGPPLAAPNVTCVLGSFVVGAPPPTVTFTANATNGPVPLNVQFGSAGIDDYGETITTWSWAFGDGAISANQNPSHLYTNAGTFYPTLFATNILGITVAGSGPASITVSSLTPPRISSLMLSGTNLVLNATNGVLGGRYYVLTSTNLTLPLNKWTSVATNVLSANGNFTITVTNAVTLNVPSRFYILQTE